MAETEGKNRAQKRDTHITVSSTDHTNTSVQAYRALRQHAEMFKAFDLSISDDDYQRISLTDGILELCLEYRSQRKLLARIDHLRIRAEFFGSEHEVRSPYELQLRLGGPLGGIYSFVDVGREPAQAETINHLLLDSGIVQELATQVDLESLSVSWSCERRSWELTVEPYPGCHVYTVFPPVRYTVRLKDYEVRAIHEFFVQASEVLTASKVANDRNGDKNE